MAYKDHRWLTPSIQVAPEILEVYRTTHQFYEEIQYREALDRHADWYYATAEQHRRELEKMRSDINLFSWFCRKK